MEKLVELFRKLEELSKSFEIFEGLEDILSFESFEAFDSENAFDFFNINLPDSYKIGIPSYFSSILLPFNNAEFYINKIQNVYFESGLEKIYKEMKEIPFFELNLSSNDDFITYSKMFNKFLFKTDFEIRDIEKSFSERFLEINDTKTRKSFSDYREDVVFNNNEKFERYYFNFEEDFDTFGEKLADVLKSSLKNKDRAKGY